MDVDYVFTQEESSSRGLSLLLFSLNLYVSGAVSEEQVVGLVSLLLERGVDLSLECNEGNALQFVCKNFRKMDINLVSCILTSSTRDQVSLALQAIEDKGSREILF